jgi:hypothetical protein
MWSRYSTTRPDYAFTRKWIFESEEFLQMVFIIGVASKLHLSPFDISIFALNMIHPSLTNVLTLVF